MNYECAHCKAVLFIGNAVAWPEQCPTCRTWNPGFRSPGFAQVIQTPTTSVIHPGLSIGIPL